MKRLHFSVEIEASREKVWKSLWTDENYRSWTAAFHPGSYAVSDWKEGSPVQFLGPEGGGIGSIIERLVENEYMSFEHLHEIKDFKVQPGDENSEQWAGAHENYRLINRDGFTELQVELDTTDEMASYFEKTWPEALEKLKQIAESKLAE